MAAKVNGKLVDLSVILNEGDDLSFIHFSDQEGKNIFWHTAAHVFAQAVMRIWPKALPTIGPPIENGFYYDFANLEISEKDFYATIGDIAAEKKKGRTSEKERLLCVTIGAGALDIAVATVVYQRALEKGHGEKFSFV